MKKLTLKMALVALMCIGFTTQASADGHADCPEFAAAVYERWPNADDYCLEVVERDGKKYARFEAEVVSQSPSGTYVRYSKADGSKGPSRKVNPPDGFEAMISGRGVEIGDLDPRQTVNVYLPQMAWAPEPEPMAAAVAAPPPEPEPMPEPEPEPAPVMPTTAGNMGWLAVFGAMFLLLGGALRFARQR
jgi:hypothetical protein